MAKLNIILSTPQLVPSLDTAEVDKVYQVCKKNLIHSTVVEKIGNYVDLRHLTEGTGGVYFLYNNTQKDIPYIVRYREVDLKENVLPFQSKGIRQVLVWRNKGIPSFAGFAAKVFWEYLYPKYKCLISDSQQSPDGKNFWSYALTDAISKGKNIKMINTNDWSSLDITSRDQLLELDTKIWGTKEWFRRIILVIY